MKHVKKLSLLLVPLLTHTSFVIAANCGDPSLEFTALGEQYFELDSESRTIPPAPKELPAALVEILTNADFSSGTGTRTECHLVNGEPEQITLEFNLEKIDVSTRADEVVISATESNSRERHEHTDSIAIPLEIERLELIDRNQLNASRKLRQTGTSGSYLEEIQMQAKRSNDKIEVTQWRYVNPPRQGGEAGTCSPRSCHSASV